MQGLPLLFHSLIPKPFANAEEASASSQARFPSCLQITELQEAAANSSQESQQNKTTKLPSNLCFSNLQARGSFGAFPEQQGPTPTRLR